MDEQLFSIIGKLYYDLVRSQAIIDNLQQQVQALKQTVESHQNSSIDDSGH